MLENDRKTRPGGRTAQVTERVNRAVLDILVEGRVDACTFKAVAERAKVERSTLYRRYDDQWEMLIDAITAYAGDEVMPDSTGSLVEDLKSVLRRLAAQLESPLGPALIATSAELHASSADHHIRAFFDRRIEQLRPLFDAAVERGELAREVDYEELFTLLAGPIYFRLFIAARPVEPGWIDRVVDAVCATFCR